MKYDIEIIKKVVSDFKNGKNKSQLSKEYLIPRPTIKYWINSDIVNSLFKKEVNVRIEIDECYERIKSKNKLYNFILGLYLGDGNISSNGTKSNSYKLRITQDNKYQNSIREIKDSLSDFFDKNSSITESEGCTILTIFDKNLPIYFPQHGIGKKHDRKIELSDFQRKNIDYESLLRGLWTSDGSFYRAKIGKYSYERYNFTNKSQDIISLFEESLLALNIKYDKRVKKNDIHIIQIQKGSEVNKMKKIVGIKY